MIKTVNMLLFLLILAIYISIPPVLAGDAVSGVNGKAEGVYGNNDSNETKAVAASVSAPISKQFGFQIDGIVGEINPEDLHGIGGHAFWRDSDVGLLGITGSWAEVGKIEVNRVGIEGEYYYNKFTIGGSVGHQSGDISDAGYGSINLSYYLIDDLMLSISTSRSDNDDHYGIIAEYQTPVPGLSIFASAANGDDDYENVLCGIRYYFGDKKSLIKRHREDDPANNLIGTIKENYSKIQAAAKAQRTNASGSGNVQPIEGEEGGYVIITNPPDIEVEDDYYSSGSFYGSSGSFESQLVWSSFEGELSNPN